MASKYHDLITDYCVARGISVPAGFGRNTPSRYAIVRAHLAPPKLVATTWFKVADVLYYIEHHLAPESGETLTASIQILDLQAGELLAYHGGERLEYVGPLPTITLPNQALQPTAEAGGVPLRLRPVGVTYRRVAVGSSSGARYILDATKSSNTL